MVKVFRYLMLTNGDLLCRCFKVESLRERLFLISRQPSESNMEEIKPQEHPGGQISAYRQVTADYATFLGRQVQPRLHFFVGGL